MIYDEIAIHDSESENAPGSIGEELIMTQKKDEAAQPQAKIDPSMLYRPLGLKAVLAAHLMLKSKPLKKKIA